MMWDYRVLRSVESSKKLQWYNYRIIEVHYDDNEKPEGWCETDVSAMDLNELRVTLNLMRRAFKKDILEIQGRKLVWADPDDAPPLNKDWFEKADLYDGDKLIKKGKK